MDADAEFFISLPIAEEDLRRLESIVREHDIFCAFGCDADQDPYQVITWHEQRVVHGSEIYVQLDRNVLNDVLSLALPASVGSEHDCSERGRTGAAIMAFLQLSDAVVDPGIALQENPDRGLEELALFRRADNVNPAVYVEIAMGRLNHLPPSELPPYNKPLPKADFHKHIRGRRNLFVGLLKVADLELSPLPPVEKMLELLRWSHHDFLHLASVTLLAGAFFSPKRVRPLLKDLRSNDRSKALAGVNNALWDLQGIVAWVRRLETHQSGTRYWLLCSRDRALKDLAMTSICDADEPGTTKIGFKAYIERHWPSKEATEIVATAMALQDDRDNPLRWLNQPKDDRYVEAMRTELESRLLKWHP